MSRSITLQLVGIHPRVYEKHKLDLRSLFKKKLGNLKVGLLGKGVVDLGGVGRVNE